MNLDVARPQLSVDAYLGIEEIGTCQVIMDAGFDNTNLFVVGSDQLGGPQLSVFPDKM